MKHSEALVLIEEMLKSYREKAGMTSASFDCGVLMSALATIMTESDEAVDYIRRGSK